MDERLLALADVVNAAMPNGSPRLEMYKERILERTRSNITNRSAASDTNTPARSVHQAVTADVTATKASWTNIRRNVKTLGYVLSAFKSSTKDHAPRASNHVDRPDKETVGESSPRHATVVGKSTFTEDSVTINGKTSISIQTDKVVVERGDSRGSLFKRTRSSKQKNKHRSQQVALPDSHLGLEELRSQALASTSVKSAASSRKQSKREKKKKKHDLVSLAQTYVEKEPRKASLVVSGKTASSSEAKNNDGVKKQRSRSASVTRGSKPEVKSRSTSSEVEKQGQRHKIRSTNTEKRHQSASVDRNPVPQSHGKVKATVSVADEYTNNINKPDVKAVKMKKLKGIKSGITQNLYRTQNKEPSDENKLHDSAAHKKPDRRPSRASGEHHPAKSQSQRKSSADKGGKSESRKKAAGDNSKDQGDISNSKVGPKGKPIGSADVKEKKTECKSRQRKRQPDGDGNNRKGVRESERGGSKERSSSVDRPVTNKTGGSDKSAHHEKKRVRTEKETERVEGVETLDNTEKQDDIEKGKVGLEPLIKADPIDEDELEAIKSELKPPGNPELEELEDLVAHIGEDGEAEEEIDPEVVTKVEEQIFDKIKFYNDIKDNVKIKPWYMKKKITLRGEARAYTSRFEGKLSGGGGGAGYLARIKITFNKLSRELSNYMALMVPWDGKIKDIESYFGSVVASYFTFLRWLFWINFIMSLICGVCIIMPEVMFGPDMGSVDYKSVPENEQQEASYLKSLWNFNGFAQVSPLFYGYYSSVKKFESGFRMPFAYLVGNLMMFGYSFLTILRQIAQNSKDEKASDKDDNFTFSWKTFSSWDYMIGNEETAKNKYKALVISIRESITESKESAKKITTQTKVLRYFANFLVLVVLGASTYAIFLTVGRSRKFEQRAKEFGPDSVSWVESNEVSLVLSGVTALFPILFDLIANLENYHPRIALQRSLYRIMALYLLNLYTLYIALYWKIQDIQEQAKVANETFYANLNMSLIIPCTTTTSPPPVTSSVNINTTALSAMVNTTAAPVMGSCGIPEFTPDVTCWETMVGQELIKLTVFDFVTTVAMIYITEFLRACFVRVFNACWCWDLERHFPAYAEFSLAENLLHLVNNQGMVWMGTLFSPALPMLNLFKLLCLFYVRAWSVMVCNVPHERIFKAGSDNFYLMLLLFMLYLVMIPIAFAMVNIKPSRNCGPYRKTEYMYLIITEWLKDVFPESIFNVFRYLTSPGAMIPILILLFLAIYYLSSSNDALQGTVLDLKKQLQYERTEGKKKVFNMNKAMAQGNEGPGGKSLSRASSRANIDQKGKLSRSSSASKMVTNESSGVNSALLATKFVSRAKLSSKLNTTVEDEEE